MNIVKTIKLLFSLEENICHEHKNVDINSNSQYGMYSAPSSKKWKWININNITSCLLVLISEMPLSYYILWLQENFYNFST
jgi:hypothetical protein